MLLPPLADSVAGATPTSIPALGEDSGRVFASLGYSSAEVERLCEVWSTP
jgi:hypothetical protein